MNYRIILLAALVMIVSLGAVSASDNTTLSPTAASQDIDIIADDDDFIEFEEGTGSIIADIEVGWPDEIKVGDEIEIPFTIPEDMQSNVALFIDNQRIDDGQVADENLPYYVFIDDFGTHSLKFKFYGDDKYAPVLKTKTYTISDYRFSVDVPQEDVVYGRDVSATVNFPFDATGYVTVGGVKHVIGETDIYLVVPLKNLKIGTNQIPITYSGDEKYKSKTVNVIVNVKAEVSYSGNMPYNNATFYLKLPSDAEGNLEVTVDGNNTKTSKMTNGLAEVKFDNLAIGGHDFKARYTGNDYGCSESQRHFEITPDITVDSFKTTKDKNYVKIGLPEGESGKVEVKVYRFVDVFGSLVIDELTKSVDVTDGTVIEYSTLYYGYYTFDIRYNSKGGYSYNVLLEGYVRDEFSMNITAPSNVLADDDAVYVNVSCLSTDNGIIELYIDGEFYDVVYCEGSSEFTFYIEQALKTGSHNLTVKFTGNERYLAMEKSVTITSGYVSFSVPDEIIIGSDDVISVETVYDATGNLVVYVDGSEFARKAIKEGYASISMSSLSFKTHTIRVSYEKGNYPAVSTTKVLNVSYTFSMPDEKVAYAGDGLYIIDVPAELESDKFVVKVDNVIYPIIKTSSGLAINISALDLGSHIISVSHPGNDKFYALSIEKTIEVAPAITVPSQIIFGKDDSISLILPKDPQGKLVLYELDENYGTYIALRGFDFEAYGDKAIAEIPLSYFDIGSYNIKLSYSGDDYNVTDRFEEISVQLDINYNRQIQYSKKSTITLNLPDAEGRIDVYIDGEYVDIVDFVDGIAKIQFGDLEVGQHYFELMYADDYSFDYEGFFIVYPVIGVPTTTVIDADQSIILNSGSEPVGTVTVYADGKKYKQIDLDEGKQTISLAGLENGVHNLRIVYDSWDDLKYEKNCTVTTKKASITAKDMSMSYLDGSKFKVLVKDYKGNPVKKGQSVKFYVDGKLFKTVKTDAKGYASVVLTHVPKTHTVKAVYKATSVSKKVTVKQIMTLKKVTVKKSAKSLVLTLTLKKVKGKYLKNKDITFKFSGKTYKTKTNSKGVAKVTVPSAVLKKLKVSKKVTYQATYVKATVKQNVVVKK